MSDRFYISEITGFEIRAHGIRGNRSTHVYIHDRAYCHKIVRTWKSHGGRRGAEAGAVGVRAAQSRTRPLRAVAAWSPEAVMLPLWWPRSACVYCGARIRLERSGHDAKRHRAHDPRWLACDDHARLVPLDPLLQP
jgi:hypothetical protein